MIADDRSNPQVLRARRWRERALDAFFSHVDEAHGWPAGEEPCYDCWALMEVAAYAIAEEARWMERTQARPRALDLDGVTREKGERTRE